MTEPAKITPAPGLDSVTFNEVQLLLAEKRTSLATLRTGIAIFAFPLSVLSVLIATSKAYRLAEVIQWLIPLLILCAALTGFGIYLIGRAMRRIRRYDHLLDAMKSQNPRLAELLD